MRMDDLLHSTARNEGLLETGSLSFKWVDFRIDRTDLRDFTRRVMTIVDPVDKKRGSIIDCLQRDDSRPMLEGSKSWEREALVKTGISPTDGDGNSNGMCLAWEMSLNGKAAVRCDHGLGFRIHRPIVFDIYENEEEVKKWGGKGVLQKVADARQFPFRPVRAVRAWHPRTRSSKRACVYVPVD